MRVRLLLVILASLTLLFTTSTVAAPVGPVVIVGETGGSSQTRAILRRLLAQEIDRSLPDAPRLGAPRYELSGAAQLVRVPDATGVVLNCEVSLLLVEKPGGAVRALLHGRAHLNRAHKRAVEAGGDDADVEDALRLAVRGALRPLRSAVGLAP